MPLAGFKPAMQASQRPQTHVLDRAATGIGTGKVYLLLQMQKNLIYFFQWWMQQWSSQKLVDVSHRVVEAIWNVMAHAQKSDFVFRRNGRVHLTLRLLMSIYRAPSKAINANVVYIWTYIWQRWNSLFLFAAQCFNTESMQRGFLCHICV